MWWRGAGLLAVAAVGLTAVLLWRQSVPSAAPPPTRHVHALGVDPADDTLYAATHQGLYQVTGDRPATLVSDRTPDLMGFTVAGPNRFLASGHPDGQGEEPDYLGLVESVDAGATWRPVSLSGTADLHSIGVSATTVYAIDAVSGSLLVTTDQRRWRTQSRPAPGDLAVSPTDPGSLIVTTGQDMRRSADAGRAWTDLPGPPLVLLDWPEARTLTGITADGRLQLSLDGGRSWQPRATVPGAPQALHAVSTAQLYVATDAGIFASVDGGWSFNPVEF